MYASVIVEIGVKNVDKTFTYKVPLEYTNDIKIGIRVKVPFGNMKLEGFVIDIFDNYKEDYDIKEIEELVDSEPILTDEMFKLADYITETTLCSKISAYQVMLPKALKAKNKVDLKIKYDKYIVLNKSKENVIEYIKNSRYDKQKELLNKLLIEDKIKITRIDSTINTLLKT